MKTRKPLIFALITCLVVVAGVSIYSVTSLSATSEHYVPYEESISQLAKSLVGKPYKTGGNTPAGFDSPGFVRYVYAHATPKKALYLPTTIDEQFKGDYPIIADSLTDKSTLCSGDLVFFKEKGHLQNVGIYLDYNQFITVTADKGVVIQDLNSPRWEKSYFEAKRYTGLSPEVQKPIKEIAALAKQGKVKGCEFKLGTRKEEVIKKWGPPDNDHGLPNFPVIEYTKKGYLFVLDPKNHTVVSIETTRDPICDRMDIRKVLGHEPVRGEQGDSSISLEGYAVGKYYLGFVTGPSTNLYGVYSHSFIHHFETTNEKFDGFIKKIIQPVNNFFS